MISTEVKISLLLEEIALILENANSEIDRIESKKEVDTLWQNSLQQE